MPRIPLTWLAEHVELPAGLTAEQLAADLVRVGLEEEAIHAAAVTGPLVVGRVVERTPGAAEERQDDQLVPRRRRAGAQRARRRLRGASSAARTTSTSVTASSSRCPVPCCPGRSRSRPARRTGTCPTA